jgi:hypothetical protein
VKRPVELAASDNRSWNSMNLTDVGSSLHPWTWEWSRTQLRPSALNENLRISRKLLNAYWVVIERTEDGNWRTDYTQKPCIIAWCQCRLYPWIARRRIAWTTMIEIANAFINESVYNPNNWPHPPTTMRWVALLQAISRTHARTRSKVVDADPEGQREVIITLFCASRIATWRLHGTRHVLTTRQSKTMNAARII